MDSAERYRKEFDLIFQELDEKEKLAEQAKSDRRSVFITKLLGYKSIQDLLAAMPVEDRIQFIDECVRRKFPLDAESS